MNNIELDIPEEAIMELKSFEELFKTFQMKTDDMTIIIPVEACTMDEIINFLTDGTAGLSSYYIHKVRIKDRNYYLVDVHTNG